MGKLIAIQAFTFISDISSFLGQSEKLDKILKIKLCET